MRCQCLCGWWMVWNSHADSIVVCGDCKRRYALPRPSGDVRPLGLSMSADCLDDPQDYTRSAGAPEKGFDAPVDEGVWDGR